MPEPSAQRGLADVVLDPSRPVELRRNAAAQLARSIKRFGPLVSADQEARWPRMPGPGEEADAQLRAALATVVGTLRAVAPKRLGERPRPAPARSS